MQDTNMRLVIRVARTTLSVSTISADGAVDFIPYVVKSGVSMAANIQDRACAAEVVCQGGGDGGVASADGACRPI